MENTDNVIAVNTGTNPLLTVALFLSIIAGVIFAGSHFSQRHSAAKELEAAMADTVSVVSSISR